MNVLMCPVCGEELSKNTHTYQCANKHSFDIAKQGYCHLLQSQSKKQHGDTKEMLLARKYIQEHGYYEEVAKEIVKMIKPLPKKTVVDIGCGIGYYTSYIEETFHTNVIGIDISKDALKIASKEHQHVDFFVASNNALPVQHHSVDIITSIFSPFYEKEVMRVLKKDGYFITVVPNENHLIELKKIIYDEIIKKNEERHELMSSQFVLMKEKNVKAHFTLDRASIEQLFLMTPHYWTSSVSGKKRLEKIETLILQLDVTIKVYQYQVDGNSVK